MTVVALAGLPMFMTFSNHPDDRSENYHGHHSIKNTEYATEDDHEVKAKNVSSSSVG